MVETIDKAIAVFAGRQYGYITRAQLYSVGLSRRAIEYRIELGRLIPVHRGVYAVGHVNLTPVARAMAAVLACGNGAALSHGSAASLWGFFTRWETPLEVMATSKRRRRGIKTHRSSTLPRRDITRQLGVRVTTPARTALDIAPRLSEKRLTRVVHDALHARVLHEDALADVLERNPYHPGAKRLWPFVQSTTGLTRSELEFDFVAFARRHGLPTPMTNVELHGYHVDVLFVRERVIVEVNSFEFHRFRRNFEGDRDRDADQLAAGYLTVRVTHERLNERPEYEARRLNAILRSRRAAA